MLFDKAQRERQVAHSQNIKSVSNLLGNDHKVQYLG